MRDDFILNSSNSALLIVDMTREGLHAYTREEAAQMVSEVERLIDESGIRPIYCNTMWEEAKDLAQHPSISNRRAWGTPPFTQIIGKKLQSAFCYDYCCGLTLPSDLDNFLKSNGITNILVTGVEKNLCVWDTALDGVKHGYNVQLIDDLCWSSKWAKNAAKTPDPENYAAKIEIVSKENFIKGNRRLASPPPCPPLSELDYNS